MLIIFAWIFLGNFTEQTKPKLFGTTVSINKKGRLASCSNLELTSRMFDQRSNKIGKFKAIDTSDFTVSRFQLGKCYKKDKNETTFSFLLENIKKFNIPLNTEGKTLF